MSAGGRRARPARVAGRGCAAVLLVAFAFVPGGAVAAVEIQAYLQAASARVAGEVGGRVWEARRRPDLADRPLAGATVTLLPRPEALIPRLEDVRSGARDSDRAFRTAVARMLAAVEDHERAVRAAGGADLVRSAVASADGVFTLPNVPAGGWVLVARHETLVPAGGSQISRKDRQMYRIGPTLEAYRSVRLWVREVAVTAGRIEAIELHDRNVWFSGVVEVRSRPDR